MDFNHKCIRVREQRELKGKIKPTTLVLARYYTFCLKKRQLIWKWLTQCFPSSTVIKPTITDCTVNSSSFVFHLLERSSHEATCNLVNMISTFSLSLLSMFAFRLSQPKSGSYLVKFSLLWRQACIFEVQFLLICFPTCFMLSFRL